MIRPLHNHVLVKENAPIPHPFLVLPLEDTLTGTVVATGPGKRLPNGKLRPILVSVGDKVRFSGTIDAMIDGFALMQDKDIIGLVDEQWERQ